MSLALAISLFGRIILHAHPAAALPAATQMLIDYRAILYAVPLPSLVFALRGKPDAQLVAAYSFLLLVFLVCVTLLVIMLPFVPWPITVGSP